MADLNREAFVAALREYELLSEQEDHRDRLGCAIKTYLEVDRSMIAKTAEVGDALRPAIGDPMDVPGYESLRDVLRFAYDQSARGKGKERHANNLPFHRQPIIELAKMSGLGGHVYQMMKKAREAGDMAARGSTVAARTEFLGVIVYAAAAYLLIGMIGDDNAS